MIPRFHPHVTAGEIAACVWPQGPRAYALARFEEAFAEAVGQRHAVAFPYGRTGLISLLESLDLQGKEIILPAYTCVVVAHAIIYAGATPVFVDSGADGNMDLAQAEAAIGSQTGALIATSIFGHPVDLDRLDAISARWPDVCILQDCAHSYTCTWKGRSVVAAGRAALFGMNISKIMTSIFGGMITTDEAELAIRLRASRDAYIRPPGLRKAVLRRLYLPAAAFAFSAPGYRLVELLRGWGLMAGLEDYYKPDRIEMPADYQTGLTAIEARIGTSQSQRLHRFIAARRAWAQHYREVFADHPLLTFFDVDAGASYSHIAVKTTHKAAVLATARRYGVELGEIIDYVVPSMAAYASKAPGSWPVATKLAGSVVNLPVSNRFDRVRAQQITARLQKAFAEIDL